MILLTGATGYVGSHLLAQLLARGTQVRCFARDIDKLPTQARVDAVQGDAMDPVAVRKAMQGIDTAYYLLHAMTHTSDFAEADRKCAQIFADAAREAGVRRIIYLGGLGRGDELSEHLASRHEVGDVLRSSGACVIEFRASVIIGAGSISFELARTLAEKLPVMITPRWVRTPAQPIAIDDVVAYLIEALTVDLPEGGIFEVGGADKVSYGDIMREYAQQRHIKRWMIPVPVLTPHVSSLWLALVVPRHAKVGKLLIEGVRNETTVHDPAALRAFSVKPKGIAQAIQQAIAELPPSRPALTGVWSFAALLVCIFASFAAAGLGNLLSPGGGDSQWYAKLAKPTWTPPGYIFGPVWTALYLMMAVAAWRVWRADGLREARLPLGLFAIHLLFNAAWTAIFFGMHRPGFAFVDIIVLWVLIALTTLLFWTRDRIAAALMLPYLAWVTFASVLNAAIFWMNR